MYIVMMKKEDAVSIVGIFHRKKNAQKFVKTLDYPWKIERHYWHITYVIANWLYERMRRANHRKYNKLVRKSRTAQRKLKNFKRMD